MSKKNKELREWALNMKKTLSMQQSQIDKVLKYYVHELDKGGKKKK